jgi:hypothetical protein
MSISIERSGGVAFVTRGGDKGIGEAIATTLAEPGAGVEPMTGLVVAVSGGFTKA